MRRNIPSLDGLRTIAVGLVILSHLKVVPGPFGLLGVRVFFVISGYLITRLLVEEFDQEGTIRLGRFYLRRTLRIFPAYYAMLAVAYFLGTPAHWSWLVSYTSNWGPDQPTNVSHAWSLGVEEQFYFLWPVILLACGKSRGRRIAVSVIALMPLVRLFWFALFHTGQTVFSLPYDFLAVGCLLALTPWRVLRTRWIVALIPTIALYHTFFVLSYGWRFAIDTLIGQSLCAVSLAAIIAWCVVAAPRALNTSVMRTLGVLSYSIYLYQQFWIHQWWPIMIGGTLACATASYLLIERPGLKVREWIENAHSSRSRGHTLGSITVG